MNPHHLGHGPNTTPPQYFYQAGPYQGAPNQYGAPPPYNNPPALQAQPVPLPAAAAAAAPNDAKPKPDTEATPNSWSDQAQHQTAAPKPPADQPSTNHSFNGSSVLAPVPAPPTAASTDTKPPVTRDG